jgi:large subunit ribosomal protein L21
LIAHPAPRTPHPAIPLVKAAQLWNFARLFPRKHSPAFRVAYAIIETGGRQHRVAEGDIIDVDLLEGDAGKETVFGDVLFHGDGDKLTHGNPLIEGATVTGEVMEQRKDKKVIAFKYRRRKGYHRTVGHRRKLTRIKITGISLGGKTSKAKKAKTAEPSEKSA